MGPRAIDWLGAALLVAVLVVMCALLVLQAISDEVAAQVVTIVA
ncbi:MAG: hypothetical protein H6Q36_253 [Chloroflexi bacterium]|jgi:hypothetical protein|nr:hypothetical protein [Chloroflexota bacterium]